MKGLSRLVVTLACAMAGPAAWAHSEGPLGLTPHDWHPDPAIKRTISLNFDFQAGANVVSWSPAARIEMRAGRQCIAGAYILFDVDERFAFDTDETMLVDLTFYRPETDGFVISYDQAVKPVAKQVRFATKAGEGIWHTETVPLEGARFANRKYYGTDLAIGGLGSRLGHPDGGGEVVLCGLALHRAAAGALRPILGDISLSVVDENGRPTAAEVGLYRADGWAPLASRGATQLQRYTETLRELPMISVPRNWSQNGRYAFFVNGSYEAKIPAGDYQLFIMKGPEYRIQQRSVTVRAGTKQSVAVAMGRWTDLPAQGWLSGDDHIHVGRPSPRGNDSVLAFTRATDVHVANLLQSGNLLGSHFSQYDFGDKGVYGADGYFLVSGQESPRTAHRGHTIGLKTKRFYWQASQYFFYDSASDLIRADGGLWGYAHVAIDAFNVHYGLALDVPRGKVDFVEMLQFGMMNTAYLYDFLNMGFKLVPTAGSDYPYIDFPGSERVYAHLDGPVTAKGWFDAVKSSRSFITNWMSADVAVNGDRRAVEYNIRSGEPVTVVAVVNVNPDFDQLDRVELVGHGEILHAESAGEASSELKLSYSFLPSSSLWLAIRAYGRNGALLHTAPIYIYLDGDRDFANRAKVADLARKYRDILTKLRNSTPSLGDDFERFEVNDLILPGWQEAKPRIDAAIDEASAVYEGLIKSAH